MKRTRWWETLRATMGVAPRAHAGRDHSRVGRRAAFEPLEPRLAFALTVNIAADSILEFGGVATATVTRTGSLAAPLTVILSTSDNNAATVPASVVIPASMASKTFNVTAVDDGVLDDWTTVTITATASGQGSAVDTILIMNDDRAPLIGSLDSDVVTVGQGSAFNLPVSSSPAPASLDHVPLAKFAGATSYQTAGADQSMQGDEFFAVDLAKTYALAGWAKSGDELGQRYLAANKQSFGVMSYDVDKLPILPEHVLRFATAADTTLAFPLNPGDTTIRLASAAGWSNAAGADAATRGLAWYGYADSTGHTYFNYTYTRNVALGGAGGLWNPGAVSGNVIALAAPWSGPALPAGTAVRNTGAGTDANFLALAEQAVPGDWTWTHVAGVFGGAVQVFGIDAPPAFRPGTAFVKPLILANQHGTAENFMTWRDVTLVPVAEGTTSAQLALPVVDMAVFGSGAPRGLALSQGTPYSWAASLIKVDLSFSYTLSAWAQNTSEVDEQPMGFASLDVDKKLIHPLHVSKHEYAADTTLAEPLLPGAHSLLVTNASGWSNEAWYGAESRSLAWYGYQDSTGHTYADYTYTRNVAFDLDEGLWAPGSIYYDAEAEGYRIQLREPWSGPALPAGAAIRNATSGETFNRPPMPVDFTTDQAWTEYKTTIGGGVWQNGQRDELAFRPGTAYIQPVFAGVSTWTGAVVSRVGVLTVNWLLEPGPNQRIALDFDVLSKPVLGGGANVVIDSVAPPKHGTAMIAPGAGPGGRPIIHYQSVNGFVGTDLITYTLRHTVTNQTQTLSITVHRLNGDPDAPPVQSQIEKDDAYTMAAGQTLVVNGAGAPTLLANDAAPAGSTTRLITGPRHGTVKLNADGTFTYTPVAGYHGTDAFRYETFSSGASFSATASIRVLPSDEALLLSRLRELGLGMLNYESVKGRFPVDNTASNFQPNGTPYLSWRVHILPYLGYGALYSQFRLNESWNSAHNMALASQMPDIFRSPGDAGGVTTTRFQIISGMGAPYYWQVDGNKLIGPRYNHFTDGESNSFLAVQSGANQAVTWTKPDDLEFDANNPLAALGTITGGRIYGLMADGSTIVLPASIAPATFKSLVTISGGEIVDAGTLRRRYAELNGGAAAVQSYGAAASSNYFRQIALAMLNHESARGRLPVAGAVAHYDPTGKPYLSWRVHLLPFLGYQQLFSQFHLDEPWDSPHNLPLMSQMPDVYRSAGDAADSTTTRVMTFNGPGAAFGYQAEGQPQYGRMLSTFTDGTQNTILFAEGGADVAVPWTKPEDMAFDQTNPLTSIGDLSRGQMRIALADGSQFVIGTDISSSALAALITPSATTINTPADELRGAAPIAARERLRTGQIDRRGSTLNSYKQIGLAALNFESATGRFPASSFAADGTPLLSWRVLILPYLGYSRLYQQFRRNEPWDSPHNLSLLKYMPDVFRSEGDAAGSTLTRVATFTGAGAPFPASGNNTTRGPLLASISDGLSNTLMFVEAGRGEAIPWTKPADLPYRPNNPATVLGDVGAVFWTEYFDGHGQGQLGAISPALLKALITHNGGESTTNPPPIVTVPDFYVHHTGGNTATSEFGVDAFDVTLDAAPTANVVLSVMVNNGAVATLDRTTLTFTPQNWNKPQRVALRGVDNHAVNADQTVNVSIEVVDAQSANAYDPVATQTFAVLIRDDDKLSFADFNGDEHVDGGDFLAWQRGLGTTSGATAEQGDADADGDVDGNDLLTWREQFAWVLSAAPTADFNDDDAINGADLAAWRGGFGSASATRSSGDANGDGVADGADFLIWQRTLHAAPGAATASAGADPNLRGDWLAGDGSLFPRVEPAAAELVATDVALTEPYNEGAARDRAFDSSPKSAPSLAAVASPDSTDEEPDAVEGGFDDVWSLFGDGDGWQALD